MKNKRITNEAHLHTTVKKKKKNLSSNEAQLIPYIPPEIFQEILCRLPVKALMRLKSVCKSWHTLISDPKFSNLHLKQSINQNRMSFMLLHYDPCYPFVYAAPDRTSETNKPIHADESDGSRVFAFLSSCNGLFCVGNAEDELFLWNPSTRESKKIPGSMIEFPKQSCTSASVFYGLGYHSASDDYKLVRVSMFHSGADFQTEVKMYSRNCGTWKRIKDFPYDFPHGSSGVFVSGGLHWIVSLWKDDVYSSMVAVLDIENENYGLIQLPELGEQTFSYIIGTLEENLALFCSSLEFSEFDMWILKEYGKIESWMRIKIRIAGIEPSVYFQPLCLLKPDKILVRIGDKRFLIYDVKQKLGFEILIPHLIVEYRMVSFVESLVSPNAP